MKRKGLLLVSGCHEKRFESLAARNQLPFPPPEGKWNDYSLKDAFELHLMLVGLDTWGASVDLAMSLFAGIDKMEAHPLNHMLGEADQWVGVGVVDDPLFKEDGSVDLYPRIYFAGPLEDLPARIAAAHAKCDGRLRSLVMVNATDSARIVRERAREIGLPEGDDFQTIWQNRAGLQ